MTDTILSAQDALAQGQKLITHGRFTEAESLLTSVLEQEPENPAIRFRLGVALQRQRKFDKAISQYSKAIEISPDMAGPYNQLGPLLERRDDAEKALAFYNTAIEHNPHNHIARINAALLLRKTGNEEEADSYYAEAMRSQLARNVINRTTISQHFIDLLDTQMYLEIGVAKGVNFHQIQSPGKIAVDPEFRIPGHYGDSEGELYFETDSDTFFKLYADNTILGKLGVAFVDGLHTYDQSLRDILNSVDYLLPGGAVVVHDCNPGSEAAAHPVLEEAIARPDYAGAWMGDVFKSILWIRANRPDLDATVLSCDCGVGVIRKHPAQSPRLNLSDRQIRNFSYSALDDDRMQLLNLKPANYLTTLLNQ